jgi:FLVCR family MFS transporter
VQSLLSKIFTRALLCFERTVELFISGILQGLTNNGAIPLFYEMAMESTYPVAEVCTSMIMTIVYNTLPLIFLLVIYFSSESGA